MKKFVILVLVLLVALGGLGYWRGWFSVSKDEKVTVQTDPAKFKKDKEQFRKTVGAKAKAMKEEVASLWTKSEALSGDEKAQAQKDLADLKKKHDRLEEQIKSLDEAGQDKFDGIKEDLAKNLEEVEKKTQELTKKLEKGKAK